MPTNQEWERAMEMLESGASYGSVSLELGVSKSGLYEHHIGVLSRNIEAMKSGLQKAEKDRQEQEKKLEQIKEKVSQWSSKAMENEKKCQQSEKQLRKLTKLEREAERIAPEIKEFGDLTEAVQSKKSDFRRLEKEVGELNKQKIEILGEVGSGGLTLGEISDYVRSCQDLEKNKRDLKSCVKDLEQEHQRLKDELNSLEAGRQSLVQESALLETVIQSSKSELQKLRSEEQKVRYEVKLDSITEEDMSNWLDRRNKKLLAQQESQIRANFLRGLK